MTRTLEELAEAWNRGDATAGHRWLFEGLLKGSKMGSGGDVHVRYLRPDVAVVVGEGGTALDDSDSEGRASTVTFVLVREPDRWRVASFQNTRRTAAPR